MPAHRKNIYLNEAMAKQLTDLRDKILNESGIRLTEQDVIRSAIEVYVEICTHHIDLTGVATASGVDRAVFRWIAADRPTSDGNQ